MGKKILTVMSNSGNDFSNDFQEFCWDHLDLDPDLMSERELRESINFYEKKVSVRSVVQDPGHYNSLDNAKEARKLAKSFGGKALTGSARQKSWAESIRKGFLESGELSDEEKTALVNCGGFTNSAKFWIENRDADAKKMTAHNIAEQYKCLMELEDKLYEAKCARIAAKINAAQKQLKKFRESCDFKFED